MDWQSKMYQVHLVFLVTQGIIFMCCIFIDVARYVLDIPWFNITFRENEEKDALPNSTEASINGITRIGQGITLLVMGCIGMAFCNMRIEKRARSRVANGALLEFKKARIETWKEHKKREEVCANVVECAICLCEYEEKDKVVQLKCHRNHVFHQQCLEQFLVNARDSGVGSPKCPLC
mmetsp:Transcript_13245/g.20691  ORF Transcript_13245/g.20691 Transcript_13245/m.20691 type:complete len:178 (-) Transcript_13245:61-594(-)